MNSTATSEILSLGALPNSEINPDMSAGFLLLQSEERKSNATQYECIHSYHPQEREVRWLWPKERA